MDSQQFPLDLQAKCFVSFAVSKSVVEEYILAYYFMISYKSCSVARAELVNYSAIPINGTIDFMKPPESSNKKLFSFPKANTAALTPDFLNQFSFYS